MGVTNAKKTEAVNAKETSDRTRRRETLDDVPANVQDLPEPVETSRRGTLRAGAAAAVATAVSTLGLSGTAAADSKYGTKRDVGVALKRGIPDVLSDLVAGGYLDGQAEVLDADLHHSKTAYHVAGDAIGVFDVKRSGERTTKIAIKRSVEGGTLHLVLFPELETHDVWLT